MTEDDVNDKTIASKDCCPECNASRSTMNNGNGELVCTNCGLVMFDKVIDDGKGWRAFTNAEFEGRAFNEVEKNPMRLALKSTDVGTHKDLYGDKIKGNKRQLFRRLQKWQKRMVVNQSRTHITADIELDKLCSALSVTTTVRQATVQLFMKLKKNNNSFRGQSIKNSLCALIYITTRVANQYRTYEEISRMAYGGEATPDRVKQISSTVSYICDKMRINLPVVSSRTLIEPRALELKLSQTVINTATDILDKATKKRITLGKDPKGIVGAVLYIASKLCGENVTQNQIANTCHVTEVTIRNRYKEIARVLSISLEGII